MPATIMYQQVPRANYDIESDPEFVELSGSDLYYIKAFPISHVRSLISIFSVVF